MGQLLNEDQRTFEGSGALGWDGFEVTLSRETGTPLVGAKSLKAVSTVNGLAYLWPTSGLAASFAVAPGARTYRVAVAILGPAGRAMQLWARRFDPGLATFTDEVTEFTATGEIQWVTVEITTVADTPAVQMYILDFASTIGSTYLVDQVFFGDSDELAAGELEIAFASDPLAESPVWTEVTSDVLRVTFSRGRSSGLSRWEAGQGSLLLENLERQYEPFYVAGANYPNVIPRKRVRFRTASGTPVFEAFADGFYPRYVSLDYATCTVPVTDGFKILAQAPLQSIYDTEVLADSPVFYYKMNETGGAVALDHSGNGKHGHYMGSAIEWEQTWPEEAHEQSAVFWPPLPDDGHLRAAMVDINVPCSWEFNLLFGNHGDAVQIFKSHHIDVPTGVTHPALIVTTDEEGIINAYWNGGAAIQIEVNPPTVVAGNGWHHVVVTVSSDSKTVKVYIDGILAGSTTSASAGVLSIPGQIMVMSLPYHPGAGITDKWSGFSARLAFYDAELSAARVAAHYDAIFAGRGDLSGERADNLLDQADWPASRRDLDPGQIELAAAYDLETEHALAALKKVEETEGGNLFVDRAGKVTFLDHYATLISRPRSLTSQATFGNEAGEINPSSLELAADTDGIANVIRVTHIDGSVSEASDATSVAKYGALALEEASIAHSAVEATGQAEWELMRLKDPQALRIRSLTVELFESNVERLCALELMDRVTANWTPPGGGSRISQEALISKITHDMTPDTWRMTIEMMPLGLADTQFWRWGTSAWEDPDTRWGWGVGT